MSLKIIKIKKSEYKNPLRLLYRAGLVDANLKESYPSFLYVSKKTYNEFKKGLYLVFKKQYPYATTKKLSLSVNMELLNYGPNVVDKGIEFGYAVVIEKPVDVIK